jgi:prepilin-type N-terminal cleavage/methylation domain-containing protein/prepilin-type processing-associated H-X9-DG protein
MRADVRRAPRRGFTLVELLVVIGIIALLISILLPALGRARKAANSVKCAANLRSILQGMQVYASQNNGAIPGSAHTTARFIYLEPTNPDPTLNPAYSDTNCPSVVGIFDWSSPIARVMGVKFEEGANGAQRTRRFQQMRDYSGFQCPENQFLASRFSGSPLNAGTGPMISYNTAMGFLLTRNTGGSGASGIGRTVGRLDQNQPPGYNVKVSKVGNAARKIYIADGARFSNTATVPDYDLTYTGSNGGAFCDQGAAMRFSQSWDRGLAQGNNNRANGTNDARVYAYRHGPTLLRSKGGSFRFNVGFFDGHVETLDDLTGADPTMWFPKGTQLGVDSNQMYADVLSRFFNNQNYTSPNFFIVP